MKKFSFILAAAAVVMAASSCDRNSNGPEIANEGKSELNFMSVASNQTKGYVDGTTFYEKATANLHKEHGSGAGMETMISRNMQASAYYTPVGTAQNVSASNYFVNETFSEGADGKWHHNPAIYWPMSSKLSVLAYSSTDPFSAKDAIWNAKNASSSLKLNFDESRTQDDVIFSAAQMASADATSIGGGAGAPTYTTGQPISMEFLHSQAWLEFQLSIADASMADKIAIKEIVIENANKTGELVLNTVDWASYDPEHDGAPVVATWNLGETDNIVFDDTYKVYGRTKVAEDYETEFNAVAEASEDLKDAQDSGIAADIAAKEAALAAAEAALEAKVKLYELVNPLNSVGAVGDHTGAPSAGAETATTCSYLDMLLPQQPKTSFVIRYVLAGQPTVLEYRYDLSTNSAKWEMGKKYVYDIDFVVSEVTIAPTVKAFVASFDGSDLAPVELL